MGSGLCGQAGDTTTKARPDFFYGATNAQFNFNFILLVILVSFLSLKRGRVEPPSTLNTPESQVRERPQLPPTSCATWRSDPPSLGHPFQRQLQSLPGAVSQPRL